MTGRILRGGGARGVLRLVLMILGVAIGVTAALFVALMPGVLNHRGEAGGARQPIYANNATPTFKYGVVDGVWNNTRFTRVLIASAAAGAPAPPGLTILPGPGQAILSPAAARLRATDPVFARLAPGRDAGRIAAAGLIDPHELYAYLGVTPRQLADSSPGVGWGGKPDQDTIRQFSGVALELAVLVLGPALIYLLVCASLSTSTRTRRYSALRLVGASRSTILTVASVEAGTAGAVGGVAGIGLYNLSNQWIGPSGIVGFAWYSGVSALTITSAIGTVIMVALTSAAIGAVGTRHALSKPLAGRFDVAERPARWWYGVPLVLGLGLLAVPLLVDNRPSSAGGGYAQANTIVALLILVGIALCSLGLILALRPLLVVAARAVSTTRLPLAVRLGARRVELQPADTMRLISGLVLLVQVAGVGAGILHLADLTAAPLGASTSASLPAGQVPPAVRTAAFQIPAEQRWIDDESVVVPGTDAPADSGDLDGYVLTTGISMIVAPCTQADRLLGVHLTGCVDGRDYRLTDTRADPGRIPALPARYRLHYLDGDGKTITYSAPARQLTYRGVEGPAAPQILITRALPPQGISPNAVINFTIATDAAGINAFLSHLAVVAPTATATVNNLDLNLLEVSRTQRGTINFGVAVGFILGMLAFVIAAIDRSVERRRQVAALAVLGFTPRTLRSVQFFQFTGSVGIALFAAVVIAHIVGNAFLRLDNIQNGWFYGTITSSVPLAAIGIAVAAIASIFIAGSNPAAEDLRRE